MAKRKGSPKTGGRKKGTPNRRTQDLKDLADRLGVNPFEVLLHFAAGDWEALGYESETVTVHGKDFSNEVYTIDPAVRAKAAAEACQYLYPKRKAIDHKLDPDSANTLVDLIKACSEEK